MTPCKIDIYGPTFRKIILMADHDVTLLLIRIFIVMFLFLHEQRPFTNSTDSEDGSDKPRRKTVSHPERLAPSALMTRHRLSDGGASHRSSALCRNRGNGDS